MSDLRLTFSRRLAMAGGIALALWPTVRNWGDWSHWYSWVQDYTAAALLIGGSWRAGRRADGQADPLLTAAWGVAVGGSYSSFTYHLWNIRRPDHGPLPPGAMTLVVGATFAIALSGLLCSVRGARGTPTG